MKYSNHYKDGKFFNEENRYKIEWNKMPEILWDYIFYKSDQAVPKDGEVPVVLVTKNSLENLKDNSVIRLGHSTLLFKIENRFWLTDPFFSERASPFSFMGPKRFHKPPISIEELPPIKAVLISHDHYDHLDEQSIKALKDKVEIFYVPLKVSKYLIDYGVPKEKIIQLDWWESVENGNVEIISTPAQHFSGRGLFDHTTTLWSSYVIKTPKVNIYFGADSGYFGGFKEIGEKYGPFDMTFLEVGAYNENWRPVQAHLDLGGKIMFPIHNGTFDLALHSWFDPFERVTKAAKEKNVSITFPKMGEPIYLNEEKETTYWWKTSI